MDLAISRWVADFVLLWKPALDICRFLSVLQCNRSLFFLLYRKQSDKGRLLFYSPFTPSPFSYIMPRLVMASAFQVPLPFYTT